MTAPAPPKIPWGRNSALFRSELHKGFLWQRYVCDFFLAAGISDVTMPRMRVRASIASASQFTDEPDILAAGRVIEVKSRSLAFQRSADLPGVVLLDTQAGHDAKRTKPYAFVDVSQSTGALLWTKGTDVRGHWTTVAVHDRKRDTKYQAYACRRFDFQPMTTLVAALKESSGNEAK